MKGGRIAAGGALALALVAFVGGWEGLRLGAYRDGGGVPTICYGATRAVRMGDVSTRADCDARLTADLIEHETGLRACLRAPDAIPDPVYLAFVSWAFNVGTGAACKSTLVRLANAGDLRGACEQLPRWNKDNGRIVRGLTNRRIAERDLCLSGLP